MKEFYMTEWIWPKNLYMTKTITPTNINLLNMTEKAWQRRTSTVEYDRKQKIKIIPLKQPTYFSHIQPYKLVVLMNLLFFYKWNEKNTLTFNFQLLFTRQTFTICSKWRRRWNFFSIFIFFYFLKYVLSRPRNRKNLQSYYDMSASV